MRERNIPMEWVETTIAAPHRSQLDPLRPGVTQAFRRFLDAGNRVLRVAHRTEAEEIVVITTFLDRGAKL